MLLNDKPINKQSEDRLMGEVRFQASWLISYTNMINLIVLLWAYMENGVLEKHL